MSKLIDADLFLEQENERYRAVKEKTSDKKTMEISRKVHFAIRAMISVAPDGVVRCRDCRNSYYFAPGWGHCDKIRQVVPEDWYCGDGEPVGEDE